MIDGERSEDEKSEIDFFDLPFDFEIRNFMIEYDFFAKI